MLLSTLTSKGDVTIPVEIRIALHLKPGNTIKFEIQNHREIIAKVEPFDDGYHAARSHHLGEWVSPEDDGAYRNL